MATNILTGGTPSASSIFNASYVAAYGGDNNLTTRWASASDYTYGSWWKYDLGAGVKRRARSVGIYPSINALKDFLVQGSDDDTNWDTLGFFIAANSESWQYFYFYNNLKRYRYYRIFIISGYTGTSVGFYEVELYDISSGCYLQNKGRDRFDLRPISNRNLYDVI